MNLILASTSSYRATLLRKLRLPFVQMDPEYREEPQPDEPPRTLCRRLATGKAHSLADQAPSPPWLIIASDQVASLPDGELLGKPGDFDHAFTQLRACSDRWVRFETAICLLSDTGVERIASEAFDLRFRKLDDTTITRYLNLDTPWDCAGSIKYESLGFTLVTDCRGRDLTGLMGLPLLLLTEMLRELGIDVINEIS